MPNKTIKTRIIQKHAVESDWLKATNFIPLKGELIIYDADATCTYPRFKVGDGITNVNDLPFSVKNPDWNETDPTVPDWAKASTKPRYTASEVGAAPASHAEDSNIHVTDTERATWNESVLLTNIAAALPTSIRWKSVTYGNGKFVAVAESSDIVAYSTDGITWTQTTLPTSIRWWSVTYGDGKFVAVAYSGSIAAYSTDGITWTQTTLPTSAYLGSVTYGNGKFVAVAESSDIAAYSADGITWTQSTLPASANWRSVTYGSGKFVAVTYNNSIAAYSTDGITWTQSTLPIYTFWYSVTYGDGKFVAVAANSNIAAYSTDGITWTQSTLPASANWQSVTYGSDKFVAIAYSSKIVAYSADGINWVNSISQLQNTSGENITSDVKEILGVDQPVSVEEKAAWNDSDVFIATYGTTTSAEIEVAYQAGKAVFCCVSGGITYPFIPMSVRWSATEHDFGYGGNASFTTYRCKNDTWSITSSDYYPKAHASTHASGGSDPITPASIGAAPASHIEDTTVHVTAEEKETWNDKKINLPETDGIVNYGTAGQFAVSDGVGGITWQTINNGDEVNY